MAGNGNWRLWRNKKNSSLTYDVRPVEGRPEEGYEVRNSAGAVEAVGPPEAWEADHEPVPQESSELAQGT